MKKIIDFIKSWLYYPKMVKYLKDKCGIEYKNSDLNILGGIVIQEN